MCYSITMKQTNIICKDCEESITFCNSVKFAQVEIRIAKQINRPDVRKSMCQIPHDEDEHRIASHLRLGHKIKLIRWWNND